MRTGTETGDEARLRKIRDVSTRKIIRRIENLRILTLQSHLPNIAELLSALDKLESLYPPLDQNADLYWRNYSEYKS